MRNKFLNVIIIMLFIFCSMLLSISNFTQATDDIESITNNTNKQKYTERSMFTEGLQNYPKTLNESQALDYASQKIIDDLFIPLFSYDHNNKEWKVVPGDASVLDKGKAYESVFENNEYHLIIYLRDDILWTDGENMTAEDWVWYYQNIICDASMNHPAYQSTLIQIDEWTSKQIRYELIDEYSFKIVFPKYITGAEYYANSQPMPKHILKPLFDNNKIQEIKELWKFDTAIKGNIISNAVWEIDTINNGHIILYKNEKYFDFNKNSNDKYNKKIYKFYNYKYMLDADTYITPDEQIFSDFIKGNVSVYNFDYKQYSKINELENVTIRNKGLEKAFTFLSFNLKNTAGNYEKLFENLSFRKSISMLIDKLRIVKDVYNNHADVCRSIIPEYSPYYNKDVLFDYEYNPQKAYELLKTMGINKSKNDNTLIDKKQNNITLEILCPDDEELISTAEVISDMLADEGITAIVDIEAYPVYIKRLRSNNWSVVLSKIIYSHFPYQMREFLHSKGTLHVWNPEQWKVSTDWERKIDENFSKYLNEKDINKRKVYIEKILNTLYNNCPIIPLTQKYMYSSEQHNHR